MPVLVGLRRARFFATWFVLHTVIVYAVAMFCTPWLGGWSYDLLYRFRLAASASQLEFVFSHLFFFSIFPACLVGAANHNYENQAGRFAWSVPTLYLIYRLLTFNVIDGQNGARSSLNYYFGQHFAIPEYHSYRELFAIAASHSDLLRGADQLRVAAPFNAGIAYSFSVLAFPQIMGTYIRRKSDGR